jgi:YHS domain-containing protein
LLVVARAFWRVMDGVLESMRGVERRSGGVKLVRDPVCGTYLAPGSALSLTTGSATHYFCSEECRSKYRTA